MEIATAKVKTVCGANNKELLNCMLKPIIATLNYN